MKSNKQRYWLVLHSRADESVSAVEKHTRFFESIKDIPAPWGLGDRPPPTAPDFGRLSSASIGLTKFFGDGVHRAMITYVYRRLLKDRGSSDDLLNITFNPAKVDVRHLIYTVIPKYVEAFDAYLVEYFDDRLIDLAWEAPSEQRVHTDPRFGVRRVNVVNFYDELLCRRAFNLTPADVMGRLQGKVENMRLLHGGVYVVAASHVLPLGDAVKLCQVMTKTLLG
jgi:hypothetical protein